MHKERSEFAANCNIQIKRTYAAQVGKHFATPGPIRVRKPNPTLAQRIARAIVAWL